MVMSKQTVVEGRAKEALQLKREEQTQKLNPKPASVEERSNDKSVNGRNDSDDETKRR